MRQWVVYYYYFLMMQIAKFGIQKCQGITTQPFSRAMIEKELFARFGDVSSSTNTTFHQIVQSYYPGAIRNSDLVAAVVDLLFSMGITPANTLLATSLCCDELARQLETDFSDIYGKHFSLGGLSGFPFAGHTGFAALTAHVPDNGFCLTVYGPHVGIAADGTVGKVERSGIKLIDTCCGSAIAASRYLEGIFNGDMVLSVNVQSFKDFQQGAVQELILPHSKRLSEASNRMVELPLALYESQDLLLKEIIGKGKDRIKRGLILLGGIQINTGPSTPDYFLPLRFEYITDQGENVMDLLPKLKEYI